MRASAAGSLPGTQFRGACGSVLELFGSLAPIPELPARGPGSGMVGRAAALMSGLPVELTSQGWQLADHAGADARRAAAQWRRDLDDLEELSQGFDGSIKVGICGPLTLAAQLGRPRAEAALADAGARRDVAQALAEGVTALVAELRTRLPGIGVTLQVDEPMLPMVLDGAVPNASGLARLRRVEAAEATTLVALLAPGAILHCCAPGAIWALADGAGFAGVHVDLTAATSSDLDASGAWLESGRTLLAGVVDTARVDEVPSADDIARAVRLFAERLALDPVTIDERVILAPACGLALWSRDAASTLMGAVAKAAELATDALRS